MILKDRGAVSATWILTVCLIVLVVLLILGALGVIRIHHVL